MKHKVRKKPRASLKRKTSRLCKKTTGSSETTLVAAAARALRLPMDRAWEASVIFNFQLIMHHAALVDELPLPDDAEPAPVFRA
jgi:Protein of unknown function (DUF4089)